jgi:hypothetical protein
MFASKDETHQDVTDKGDAWAEVRGGGDNESPDGGDDAGDAGDNSSGDNIEFPENPHADDGDDQQNDTVSLPCGHEEYDESEAPDPPHWVSCGQCDRRWKVRA